MEKIEDILVTGYETWRNNLVLFVPHLLGFVAGLALLLALVFVAVVCLIGLVLSGAVSYGGTGVDWSYVTAPLIILGIVVLAVFVLVYVLVSSYFRAGAIGMSTKALETGKTSFDVMLEYGRRKTLSVYLAELILIFINLAGIVFLLPAGIALFAGSLNLALSLFVLGMVFFIIYDTFIYFLFYPVAYAIVISDTGAVEGLKRCYDLVVKNKLPTAILLFVSMSIDIGTGMLVNAVTAFFGLVPVLGVIIGLGIILLERVFQMTVIWPLLYVWWSAFYMTRTGKTVTSRERRKVSFWKAAPRRKQVRPSLSYDIYV